MSPPSPSVSVLLEDANWYLGLNLVERLALEREAGGPPPKGGEDAEATAQRLATWKRQAPFHLEDWWARRLEYDGLDEARMRALLGESAQSLKARCPTPPDWLARLVKAFSQEEEGAAGLEVPRGDLTPIVEPLLRQTLARVLARARQLLQTHPGAPFEAEQAVRALYLNVPDQVDMLLSRTVVLEMHVARAQGPLEGATPQERFRRFVEHLAQPRRALLLLNEYPVLARLVVQQLELWEEASLELLERLAQDWPLIQRTFSPGAPPGRLVHVTGGLGDLHARGRSVRQLRFESGLQLVYKPRPMAVDARFGELLAWLNARGAPGLRAVRVLERGAYGWAEHIGSRKCQSREEVGRFYERQGAFLALLYALNANDIHQENLIADGEHPVLVDLESVCGADYGHSTPETHDSVAEFELDNSVMRVMLLPYFQKGLEGQLTDMSGIGGAGGQQSAHAQPNWENWGTDEVRLVYQRPEVEAATNRPVLPDQPIDPLQFVTALQEGFISMYKLLLRSRQELLTEGSPLERLRGVMLRTVLRVSQFYGFVLRDSTHPDLLRNAVDRDIQLDRLWFGISRSRFADLSLRLLRHEREDLWRGDIPLFRNFYDSRDLQTSTGTNLPGFFLHDSRDTVRLRLERLGEEDLNRQLWYLRASLTALAMDVGPDAQRYPMPRQIPEVGREQMLATAIAAGERLRELARWGPYGASWTGLSWTAKGWWLRALEYDLYSGLPGVALFLAYLGERTQREDFTQLARGALATLRRQLERRPRMVQYLGGYDGWAGLIYAWTHLGVLWKDPALLAEALELLPRIEPLVTQDKDLDLLRGSTGAIAPLLGLYQATGSPKALALARAVGEHLVATARPFGEGKAWLFSASPLIPLTGFSHGAAGPAWALARLYGATGEARYRELALQAIAFENGFFSAEHRNWIDMRGRTTLTPPEQPSFMASWCHGSAGIGLARLRMLRDIDAPQLRRDAEIALETSAQKGLRFSHCLCHGDHGVLELMLEGARAIDATRWSAELQRGISLMLASIQENGFLGGVPLQVETPGLMDGIAGIGYGMLRLLDPEQVPSVLTLEPPPRLANASPLPSRP